MSLVQREAERIMTTSPGEPRRQALTDALNRTQGLDGEALSGALDFNAHLITALREMVERDKSRAPWA